jgi:hypothetical protein
MPTEAIVFFAGAIGIVAFTAALTWVNAYARGYAKGYKDGGSDHYNAQKAALSPRAYEQAISYERE